MLLRGELVSGWNLAMKRTLAEVDQAFGATVVAADLRDPASATAIALHMKILFHWPKKSAVEAIGQRKQRV